MLDDPKGYGLLIEIARKKKWSPSDLIEKKHGITQNLKDLGFKIKSTPTHVEAYQVDENVLENILRQEINYNNEKTLLTDITSIRSIYVLRQGKRPRRIEDCNALMVTSNVGFARAAYTFSECRSGEQGYTPITSNFTLTNISWLKAPDFAANLITVQAIAQAYATLQIPDKELGQFFNKVEKLQKRKTIPEESLALLRAESDIHGELSKIKMEGLSIYSENTIESMVKNINEKYKNEAKQVASKKLNKEIVAHKETQAALKKFYEEDRERGARIKSMCDSVARILTILIVILVFIIAFFAFGYDFFNFDGTNKKIGKYCSAAISLYFMLTLFSKKIPTVESDILQKNFSGILESCCKKFLP